MKEKWIHDAQNFNDKNLLRVNFRPRIEIVLGEMNRQWDNWESKPKT